MNKILKFLDFVAGFYNNLPEEQKILKKGNIQNFSSNVKKTKRSMTENTKGKRSE